MATTVLTQLCVKTALRVLGWTRTLVLGALLLGLPAPLQALSGHLLPILLTTALRGAGFGIVTVCGSTAAAALAPRGRQGAAIGLYGFAVALPQVALTPVMAVAALTVLLTGHGPAIGGSANSRRRTEGRRRRSLTDR
ncbi:hypothetical protein ACPEIC_36365 [Stenotrophomonas sp. NPDC087984]